MGAFFKPEDRNCYTKTFLIAQSFAGYPGVRVIAEVKDKNEFPEEGYYSLSFFMELEEFSFRTFLFTISFGNGPMKQQEIDDTIASFLDGHIMMSLSNYIESYVAWEKAKERFMEELFPNG